MRATCLPACWPIRLFVSELLLGGWLSLRRVILLHELAPLCVIACYFLFRYSQLVRIPVIAFALSLCLERYRRLSDVLWQPLSTPCSVCAACGRFVLRSARLGVKSPGGLGFHVPACFRVRYVVLCPPHVGHLTCLAAMCFTLQQCAHCTSHSAHHILGHRPICMLGCNLTCLLATRPICLQVAAR